MDLPMLDRSLKSLALSLLIDLPEMYFLILRSNFLMLRTSDAICSMDLCKNTAWNLPSHDSESRAWSGL